MMMTRLLICAMMLFANREGLLKSGVLAPPVANILAKQQQAEVVMPKLDTVTGLKECTRCHERKTADAFSKKAAKDDGLQSACKKCDSLARAMGLTPRVYAHPLNADTGLKECLRCGDHKQSDAFRNTENCTDGLTAICKSCDAIARKAWRAANPSRCRELYRRQYHSDPLRFFGYISNRRAKRIGATPVGTYATSDIVSAHLGMWGDKCWVCGSPMVAVDHVKPISKGGLHVVANLRPICNHCNVVKSDKWPFPTTQQEAYKAIYGVGA